MFNFEFSRLRQGCAEVFGKVYKVGFSRLRQAYAEAFGNVFELGGQPVSA